MRGLYALSSPRKSASGMRARRFCIALRAEAQAPPPRVLKGTNNNAENASSLSSSHATCVTGADNNA